MVDLPDPSVPATPAKRHTLVEDFLSPTDINGTKQTAVYVYEWPVRLWHWINAVTVIVLMVTGYFIASPPPTLSGEASDHFLFGEIRLWHFVAGQIMAVGLVFRAWWAFVGNHHAKQMFIPPVWSAPWWQEVLYEARWYFFLEKTPKKYIGHNPLAQMAMFALFLLPAIVMVFTGMAIYGEGARGWSWFLFTSWMIPLFGNSFNLHTIHHWGLWVLVIFTIVHIYAAVREDIMSRQSLISTMVSGWRMFKDDKP
jgi:Ni/Fe-hydrogenase 1 B-type cytochrome subunit